MKPKLLSALNVIEVIAVVIGVSVMFVSCYRYEKTAPTPNAGVDYNVILIDGCQYLEMKTYMYSIVTHKGDCTNKIHCRQVEEILK